MVVRSKVFGNNCMELHRLERYMDFHRKQVPVCRAASDRRIGSTMVHKPVLKDSVVHTALLELGRYLIVPKKNML